MMTTNQERTLRRILHLGGRLTLPGQNGPIHIEVKRAKSEAPQDVAFAVVLQGGFLVRQYGNWKARDLYPNIAEIIDKLTPEDATLPEVADVEVAHG